MEDKKKPRRKSGLLSYRLNTLTELDADINGLIAGRLGGLNMLQQDLHAALCQTGGILTALHLSGTSKMT